MRPNCKNERWTNSQGLKTLFLIAYSQHLSQIYAFNPVIHENVLKYSRFKQTKCIFFMSKLSNTKTNII